MRNEFKHFRHWGRGFELRARILYWDGLLSANDRVLRVKIVYYRPVLYTLARSYALHDRILYHSIKLYLHAAWTMPEFVFKKILSNF